MTVDIRLTDSTSLSAPLSLIASLPFGEVEKKRLLSLNNPRRQSESLGALVCLAKLTKNSDAPLSIIRAENGKPYFADASAPHFSLSHSGGISAAAVAPAPIGLDVEIIKRRERAHDIAERFFTKEERAELFASGEDTETFFRIWTRKEATAKLYGNGLLQNYNSKNLFCLQQTIRIDERLLYICVCANTEIDRLRIDTDDCETTI